MFTVIPIRLLADVCVERRDIIYDIIIILVSNFSIMIYQ